MEKLVNKRLQWVLEQNNLIPSIQCGFCKGRSTSEQLVAMEPELQDIFINKEETIGIFFDIEHA